jgi:hypothetical protein
MRRRVLNLLAALDPDPEALEAALSSIASELGEPIGPTRAICLTIYQEWEMAQLNPRFVTFLVEKAAREDDPPSRKRAAQTT